MSPQFMKWPSQAFPSSIRLSNTAAGDVRLARRARLCEVVLNFRVCPTVTAISVAPAYPNVTQSMS